MITIYLMPRVGITSPKKFFKKTWDKLRGKEKSHFGDYVECTCQCSRCFRKFTMLTKGVASFAGIPLCEDCRAGKNPLIRPLQDNNEEK